MKKLITITNIKVSLESNYLGNKFLMPAKHEDSDYLINYNLNCYLQSCAGYQDNSYLTGSLAVVDIADDNKQAIVLESMQHELAWDAQTSSDLCNLEASEETMTVELISLLVPNTLIIVLSEEQYKFICRIVSSEVACVQELLLYHLPVKYEYQIVE